MAKKDNIENERVSPELSLNDSDEELNRKIDLMVKEGETVLADKIKHWEDNNKWFDGRQWVGEKQEYQSDTVINRVFPGIRNMVGLATDSRPKADILPAPADTTDQATVNKEKARRWGLLFDQRWDELEMNILGTKTLFQAFINDDAFWMPFWNYWDNDVDVDLMRGQDIIIDATANSVDEAGYIVFRPYKNRKWIQDNFPDHADKVIFGEVKDDKGTIKGDQDLKERLKDQVRIEDTWTDAVRIIRAGKEILYKGANPTFEFRTDEEQLNDWLAAGNDESTFRPIRNYFRHPKKPLIIIPTYNTGELFSRSIMNQLKPVQRTIDKRKQQVDENANLMANAQWVYDVNALDEEHAALLTNEPGLQIGVDGIDSIRKEPGADMPSYIMNDLMHSEETFDNILGHHDISRGAKEQTQTATEASILREADQTAVRLLVRNYESAIMSLYQWWLQLAALFYTEEHYVRVLGEDGAAEFLTLNQSDVSDGINIVIRPGSTLPVDKRTMRQDAMQLAQMNLIDPVSLYEIMELPDPKKTANRLLNWQQGIISDEPAAPPTPQAPTSQPPMAEEQVGQDVEWAQAEESRIAKGDMPEPNPDMVTPAHIEQHQQTLQSGQFPDPDALEAHARSEVQILQSNQ